MKKIGYKYSLRSDKNTDIFLFFEDFRDRTPFKDNKNIHNRDHYLAGTTIMTPRYVVGFTKNGYIVSGRDKSIESKK